MVKGLLALALSAAFVAPPAAGAMGVAADFPVVTYLVTFVDGLDGELIAEMKVPSGGSATAPTPPEHAGYRFVEWDRPFRRVTSALTVTAKYEPIAPPVTPDTPSSPASPASPATPDTPASPASPATPSTPVSPVTPSTPSTPDEPGGVEIPPVRDDTATGRVFTDDAGKPYVMLAYADGTPAAGWQYVGGRWYFANEEGKAYIGWLGINGVYYYLSADPSTIGQMQTGWIWDDGWYYAQPNGVIASSWLPISGAWYWFETAPGATFGRMRTGWLCDGGSWYYLDSSGAMRTGWLCDGGTWYFFDGSGAMVTGWRFIDAYWYFFEPSGAMARSRWVGSCYVLSNGIMATNVWVGNYHVGPDGYWDLTR